LRYSGPMGHTTLYEVLNEAMDDGTPRAIRPGDWVFVEEGAALEEGAVYVVEANGALLVREARREGGAWVFAPWNPAHHTLPLERVRVVGRVVRTTAFRMLR